MITQLHDCLSVGEAVLEDRKAISAQSERRFPTWHFSMMNDAPRNEAIEGCIRDADVTGKTIFEIGTGAGLTAMLFAKYGARKIVTCEADEQMYSIARRAIDDNQYNRQIDLIFGSSSQLLRTALADIQPDIIFTETLDCGVVGEGFYAIAEDIQALRSNTARILPERIIQYGYMIQSDEIYAMNSVSRYGDIDLRATNNFSTVNYYPVRLSQSASKSLSQTHRLKSYSYTDAQDQHQRFTSKAYRSGTCHGFLSFFHAFYGHHVVTNDVRDKSHWHQAFHPLVEALPVIAGNEYQFSMDRSGLVSAVGTVS